MTPRDTVQSYIQTGYIFVFLCQIDFFIQSVLQNQLQIAKYLSNSGIDIETNLAFLITIKFGLLNLPNCQFYKIQSSQLK
jgi:hypothetical protein